MDDVFAVAVARPERRMQPGAPGDQAGAADGFEDAMGEAERRSAGPGAPAEKSRSGTPVNRDAVPADAAADRPKMRIVPVTPHPGTVGAPELADGAAPPIPEAGTTVPTPESAVAGVLDPAGGTVPTQAPTPLHVPIPMPASATAQAPGVPAQAGMPAVTPDEVPGTAPERAPEGAVPAGAGRCVGPVAVQDRAMPQSRTVVRNPAGVPGPAVEDGAGEGAPRATAEARPGAQAPAPATAPAFADAVARSLGAAGRTTDTIAGTRMVVPAAIQVAEQVVRVVHAGRNQLRIDLSPAELGRVRVEAEFGDGRVALVIQADRAETLDLLRADVRLLERALGEAGLKLDPSAVQFSLRGEDQQRGFAMAGGGARDEGGRDEAAAGDGKDAGDGSRRDVAERLGVPTDGTVDVMV